MAVNGAVGDVSKGGKWLETLATSLLTEALKPDDVHCRPLDGLPRRRPIIRQEPDDLRVGRFVQGVSECRRTRSGVEEVFAF